MQHHIDATDQRQGADPAAQFFHRQVDRHQRRRAGRVERHARPGQAEQVGNAVGGDRAGDAGAEVRTILISSSGYDPYRVQFTTHDYAAQHADVVAKFVRASMRGWQGYLRNPGPTNEYLLKLNPALNPAQEAYTAQALRDGGFITGGDASGAQSGHMTAARWQASYEQLKSLGILQGPLDPTAAYSLKFAQ